MHLTVGSLGRVHDLLGALIQDRVIIGLHANPNYLFRCHVVSTPRPNQSATARIVSVTRCRQIGKGRPQREIADKTTLRAAITAVLSNPQRISNGSESTK